MVWEDSGDYNLTTGYIMINGGHLQIGTEQNPIQHQAHITLTGSRATSSEFPIFVTLFSKPTKSLKVPSPMQITLGRRALSNRCKIMTNPKEAHVCT